MKHYLFMPKISDPYSTIGFNRLSYKCKLVFILGSPVVVNFVSLNEAFIDFLKMSSCTKLKAPLAEKYTAK